MVDTSPEGLTVISDRYVPLVQLGEGEYATTYLARRARDGQHVVVKIPSENMLAHGSFAYEFERASLELTRVKHPHIVRVLDAGRSDGIPYAVTEYVEGESLAQRLGGAATTQSPTQIYDWLLDVAEALDFIHAKKVVHGEIRPSHILFESANHVRLTDFVFAAALNGLGKKDRVELAADQPGFTAPEITAGRLMTPASDQYALAAVAYLALVGEPPGMESPDLGVALRKRLSPEAEEDLLRALSTRPKDRFPSCYEFARAFGLERKRPRSDLPVEAHRLVEAPGAGERDEVLEAALGTAGSNGDEQDVQAGPRVDGPRGASKDVPVAAETLNPVTPGRCWRIRMGENDQYARLGRDNGFVAVGWGRLGDLEASVRTQDASSLANLVTRFQQVYGASGISARLGAAQVWRFVTELEPGDVVLVPNPEEGLLHIGAVEGSHIFVAAPQDGCRLGRRRDVRWLRDVSLADVQNVLRRRLGGAVPLLNVDGHRKYVRDLVTPGAGSGGDGNLLDGIVEALYSLPLEEFQLFLRDLFSALRFDAEILPGRSDEAWEAAGAVSARGLAEVLLRVWVTRARRDIDIESVYEMRGSLSNDENGTLITLGGFTSRARAEAEALGRKPIGLIDGRTLAALAVETWDDMTEKAQEALSVERIERATIEVEFRPRPRS